MGHHGLAAAVLLVCSTSYSGQATGVGAEGKRKVLSHSVVLKAKISNIPHAKTVTWPKLTSMRMGNLIG